MLLLFVGLFTVLLVFAGFAIDQGMWLGHRRVAQKDADTAARGGALAYLADMSTNSPCNEAAQQAAHIAQHNGAGVPNPSTCSGTDPKTQFTAKSSCTDGQGTTFAAVPSVEVQINEAQRSLFTSAFGVTSIDVGASATACVGQPSRLKGALPLFIAPPAGGADGVGGEGENGKNEGGGSENCFASNQQPAIATPCYIGFDPSGNGVFGALQLSQDGSGCTANDSHQLAAQIAVGSQAVCSVGKNIPIAHSANTASDVASGIGCRLRGGCLGASGEGACDLAFHDPQGLAGIDDFSEVFSQ
ncbi:MAG: Tad domain-containing protein, partial [Chloroflexota bacterium]|nr:Tad domain-containing protein [Chloroflexota bacterium]